MKGLQVAPAELEDVLRGLDGVADVAVSIIIIVIYIIAAIIIAADITLIIGITIVTIFNHLVADVIQRHPHCHHHHE